ncbi:hypothetical protein SAMN05216228_101392 [Rhizobium tibeticum]|uniref:Uncharacterized protein n=1 Tax=Rhizobium tibeticum TaxID=501024 RepID=A0A1H8MW74_9HYPH|nr:hypothetical protein RTCCBAU85039_4410 [Rhizobium tibeticum]SEO21498.1 hypothetical protein SAMN05216228_101392 [Rhizobium tibeticum]
MFRATGTVSSDRSLRYRRSFLISSRRSSTCHLQADHNRAKPGQSPEPAKALRPKARAQPASRAVHTSSMSKLANRATRSRNSHNMREPLRGSCPFRSAKILEALQTADEAEHRSPGTLARATRSIDLRASTPSFASRSADYNEPAGRDFGLTPIPRLVRAIPSLGSSPIVAPRQLMDLQQAVSVSCSFSSSCKSSDCISSTRNPPRTSIGVTFTELRRSFAASAARFTQSMGMNSLERRPDAAPHVQSHCTLSSRCVAIVLRIESLTKSSQSPAYATG